MGAVTNLVLVVACAAGWVSAWEALPNIPANRRAEYFLLHNDGAYKFGYDTGAASSHSAMADASNQVRGSYAYEGSAGPVQVDYTAGREGFVPSVKSAQAASHGGGAAVQATAYNSVKSSVGHAASSHSAGQQAAFRDADYDENADASYSFAIDTDEYKRQEASDAKGNVNGRYSYSGRDGNKVAVSYTAGAGKGFVIESSEGLDAAAAPVIAVNRAAIPASPPAVPYHVAPAAKIAAPVAKPWQGPVADIVWNGPNLDGSYSFSYETPELARQESADASGLVQGRYSFLADNGQKRVVDYRAGALLGFVPTGDGINPPLPAPAAAPATAAFAYSGNAAASSGYQAQSVQSSSADEPSGPADASYSFSYDATDHSRKESSDAAGNVEGVYSFTDPEGLSRTVQYVAGANKGFVVTKESSAQGTAPATKAAVKHTGYAAAPAPSFSASNAFAAQHAAATQQAVSAANTDASYSFSYQADDHARQESSDSQGNVQGFYSFKALDGVNRKIEYEAGANKGFIAKGDHLLPAGVAPATPAIAATRAGSAAGSSFVTKSASSNLGAVSSHSAAAPVDASYSFSYDTGTHSHQQSSDPSGFVRGAYSFTADDGVSRSVQYQAGANTGFIAQGDHLPKPEVGSGAAVAVKSSATSSWSAPAVPSPVVRAHAAPAPPTFKASGAAADEGYSAYSYSYETDTSSKKESSDDKGNVVGSFTFIDGAGQSRTLNYVANPSNGFVANGAHLPVAPEAGAAIAAAKSSSSATGSSSWSATNSGGAASSWSSTKSGAGADTKSAGQQNFVLHKYLPPDSANKFGYIFDTRV